MNLMDNVLSLHEDLKSRSYVHGGYKTFKISDPKPRIISKASVRDRLLHRAIYRILYPYFDDKFIFDSYSCRKYKGTHRALGCFRNFHRSSGFSNTKTLWVLKCDVRKFFDSIDHNILFFILEKHIADEKVAGLLTEIIGSFHKTPGKGLPLGNLTSQLLVNIYMNEFDQFVKHDLRIKYYIRYADDFVILSQDKTCLLELIPKIKNFLQNDLSLGLHPNKVSVETFASGVDYLGWVHFPNHMVLRTATRRKLLRNIRNTNKEEVVQSYLGLLKHGNTYKLQKQIEKFQ